MSWVRIAFRMECHYVLQGNFSGFGNIVLLFNLLIVLKSVIIIDILWWIWTFTFLKLGICMIEICFHILKALWRRWKCIIVLSLYLVLFILLWSKHLNRLTLYLLIHKKVIVPWTCKNAWSLNWRWRSRQSFINCSCLCHLNLLSLLQLLLSCKRKRFGRNCALRGKTSTIIWIESCVGSGWKISSVKAISR